MRLLMLFLLSEVVVGKAPMVARPSSDTVDAIVKALHTPARALQLMRDNNLPIGAPLTGRNATLLHLITHMVDSSASLTALKYLLAQEETVGTVELNTPDCDGLRPLHCAARNGNQQTVELLLAKGARVDLLDNSGKSPIDFAEEGGHTDVAGLLRTYAQAQADLPATQSEEGTSSVPFFLVNLNELAAAGGIDPVIGRVPEIMTVLEALSKRHKNNPLLVGAAGVGKTAIAEGIADLIVREEVPPEFRNKTLYTINVGALTAGTGGRGMLEERVMQFLAFAEAHPDTLFFIDEVHLIATGSATGGVDIASLLKPALAKGTLRVIAATTDAEYQRHILNDKALNRRFTVIRIAEPSKEDALEVALAARDRLALHHGLEISDSAVIAAVELAHHFPEQKLPDISLSLLDEAAAALNLNRGRVTLSLADIKDKLTRRADALSALRGKRKKQVQNEIKQLEDMQKEQDKALAQHVDTKLDTLQQEADKLLEAQADNDNLSKVRKKLDKAQRQKKLEKLHIAQLIARKLDIPVEKILKTEQDSIANLSTNLEQHVFGQDDALAAITDTLTISYAGLNTEGHVLGSFLLAGPTGTGKTHTAQMLAEQLFGDKRHLLRYDMSEYSEHHTVSSLLGAPPGYVGYESGGKLTSDVLRTPHAVVLFDEIEKAHPQFQNILLQILEGARLTDRRSETVDFSNVIIVMTSNSDDLARDFRPEVRNRIDNILTYKALSPEVMEQLVQTQLAILNTKLQEQGIVISLGDAAMTQLSTEGYDPQFGARPLERVFRRRIKSPLADMLVRGELKAGHYTIDINADGSVALQRE